MIDDLLKDMDEVLNVKSPSKVYKPSQNHLQPDPISIEFSSNRKSFSQSPMKNKNDLDSLLDELEEMKFEKSKTPKSNEFNKPIQSKTNEINKQVQSKGKCFQILLSNEEKICNESHAHKGQTICDKLRCTNCDRKVTIFCGFSFAKDCDYLFFRNYSMDSEKIRKKLIKNEKFTAYHCQCSWISVDKTLNITNDSQYKWVCGGH